ncbi:hypothetical protein NLX71_11660 [Paenibacillus sp. MZ04-78.2]|uniref:hypothetical protein n=1 Tax=Paenibacillus sp. MZ04-78.2 TaxID=2962034 RepID=UPI0020B8E9E2|nr:hypothetical protein [Paenibacillus sp. MZ04-78.2]MCP3773957.1 hypothetical protein [Paenibacillus sp. MZ04-78.2]
MDKRLFCQGTDLLSSWMGLYSRALLMDMHNLSKSMQQFLERAAGTKGRKTIRDSE